jgi:hypothetical protein
MGQGHLHSRHRQLSTELELCALPDLSGWIADCHEDSVGGDDPDWDQRGDEIVGRPRADVPRSTQESVLRYNRPLLEDGELVYEFFYEPGKTVVHPAIDRLTFMLHPDGIRIHWLTDAQYERSGLNPDNSKQNTRTAVGPAPCH